MKEIKGDIYNIEEELIGIVTTKERNIFSRKNYILVSDDIKVGKYGYIANISSKELKGNNSYVKVRSIDLFEDGDVVFINKEGQIIFLYERNSNHNSILATEICNHRCIMCPQPPVNKENNRTNFNLKLIKLLDKNTKEIGITGGEPTIIGDDLFKLIHAIKKHTPKAFLSILSNGVRFSDIQYTKKLALCNHNNLQIDIPIFSDIPSEHNAVVGANTFYKIIQGLYNLAKYRQRIGIRIVINKKTYKRLAQFAEYIYRNMPFVSQVAFMQMEMTGLAIENQEEVWIDPYEYQSELENAIIHLENRGMNPVIYNAQLCILPESIRKYACRSISSWKDIYIDECVGCYMQNQCAGFFQSNKDWHSKYIKRFNV